MEVCVRRTSIAGSCTNSRSNASCPSKPCRYLSCTQRRKLGSSTAARTPSSIVSGSSSAKQQPQAATSQSAAAATYRAARPRKQFWRASLRHCSADRRPAILKKRQIFNNIAINLHACISTTSVHATFACISLTIIRNV